MVDKIIDLMCKNENIDFVVSRETATKVVNKLWQDGIKFGLPDEEDTLIEVIREINNSVTIVISQTLEKEGYVYFVENYFGESGNAKEMGGKFMPVVVEEEIEDLIDYSNIESSVVII